MVQPILPAQDSATSFCLMCRPSHCRGRSPMEVAPPSVAIAYQLDLTRCQEIIIQFRVFAFAVCAAQDMTQYCLSHGKVWGPLSILLPFEDSSWSVTCKSAYFEACWRGSNRWKVTMSTSHATHKKQPKPPMHRVRSVFFLPVSVGVFISVSLSCVSVGLRTHTFPDGYPSKELQIMSDWNQDTNSSQT